MSSQTETLQSVKTAFNAAIDFAISQGIEAATFLDAWRHGDTSEWPEFVPPTVEAGPKQAAPVSGLTLALPTFDSFCQKHSLQQDKMRSHGGVWTEIALEDVHKAVQEYVISQKPVGKCLTYEEANQASLKSPFVWYGELPYGKNLYAEPLIAPPVNFSDSQIKEAVDAVDFSQMVTADDFIYMVARAGLALAAPSKANCISVDSLE